MKHPGEVTTLKDELMCEAVREAFALPAELLIPGEIRTYSSFTVRGTEPDEAPAPE